MSIRRIRKIGVSACFGLTLVALCAGSSCPFNGSGGTGGLSPLPPPGNRPPRILITSVTPAAVVQGDPVSIGITGSDAEDAAVARVFASTSANPAIADEVAIQSGIAIGPGTASTIVNWDTTGLSVGSYNIFAEIDDRTYNPSTGAGNQPVRVTSATIVIVTPPGTGEENTSPNVNVKLPSIDVGLSNDDTLVVSFDVKDNESDRDTLSVSILFDKDRTTSNDAAQPPLVVGAETIAPGTIPANTFATRQLNIPIDLTTLPFRADTDELGRPLPYYVRVRINDGKGGIVDGYASGAVQLLAAASGVVDLLSVGGRTAGVTFQGFGGVPNSPRFGDRAGSGFAPLGDLDGDGIDDFGIISETAAPFGAEGSGGVSLIYGRRRQIDTSQENAAFTQGRYSGVLSLNTVGTFVDFPPNDSRFQRFFKIRGNQCPQSFSGGVADTLGITSVVAMPDVTGDGRPEVITGSPYTKNAGEREDLDGCDQCASSQNITLLTNVRGINPSLTGQVMNANVTTIPGQWVPSTPPIGKPTAGTENTTVNGLQSERLVRMSRLTVQISGRLTTTPQPPAAQPISITIKLENKYGPEQTVDVMTDTSGNLNQTPIVFTSDPFPIEGGKAIPPSLYDGRFSIFIMTDVPFTINNVQVMIDGTIATPQPRGLRLAYLDDFPRPLSGVFGCGSESTLPLNPLGLPLWVGSAGDKTWLGPVAPPIANLERPFDTSFFNLYQEYFEGHRLEDMTPFFTGYAGNVGDDDDLGLYESALVFMSASDELYLGQNATGQYDGTGCPVQPLGLFGQDPGGCRNGSKRGARFRGAWYNPDGVGTGVGWKGANGSGGHLYDPTNLFGYTVDVTPNMDHIYSPTSELLISAPGGGSARSDVGTVNSSTASVALTGTYDDATSFKVATFDLGRTFSNVTAAYLTIRGFGVNLPRLRLSLLDENNFELPFSDSILQLWNGDTLNQGSLLDFFPDYFGPDTSVDPPLFPWVLTDFSSLVTQKEIRLPVFASQEFGVGLVLLAEDIKQVLMTGKGKLLLQVLTDPPKGACCYDDQGFTVCQVLSQIACVQKSGVFHGVGTDCTQPGIICAQPGAGGTPLPEEFYAFPVADPLAFIISANITIEGTTQGEGHVWLIEGQDYSRDGGIQADCQAVQIPGNGDPESSETRPNSWPSAGCDGDFIPPQRSYCFPKNMAWLRGEIVGDGLGFARFAGDPNLDTVPDIICGAPEASSVAYGPVNITQSIPPANYIDLGNCPPLESGANKRTHNGKVYLIYGTATLQSGRPCAYERFEIRGSHDNDEFGRVQGLVGGVQGQYGDMNGDGIDDVFFAAEKYDAIDNLNDGVTIQNRGVDAGMVGVLFGSPINLTGEVAINVERVGTPNFPGVKFIGGSAGVRLSGSEPAKASNVWYPVAGGTTIRYQPLLPVIDRGQHGANSAGDLNQDGFADLLMTAPGQTWPSAAVEFIGAINDGATITVVGPIANRTFEFDFNDATVPGNIPVRPASSSALDAQAAFYDVLTRSSDEALNAAGVTSRTNFPDPLPDIPTVKFVGRSSLLFNVTTNSASVNIKLVTRQGVAYLVFGSPTLLTNKTFYLPEDMNRRDLNGNRVLKGIVFVSPYEKNTPAENDSTFDPLETPDEAPIEAVCRIGDVDNDGFPDIILGAPTADLINIVAPEQRRQSAGEAYVIYGSQVGLNGPNAP